jgi:hypothetical protein
MELSPGDKVWVSMIPFGPWNVVAVNGKNAWLSRDSQNIVSNVDDCEPAIVRDLCVGDKVQYLKRYNEDDPEESEGIICAVFKWNNSEFAVMGPSRQGYCPVLSATSEFKLIGPCSGEK